ncbi:MAG: hypothetical protein RIS52_1227 [Pseudomonadota bacterium]|jgi:hypothetical protein
MENAFVASLSAKHAGIDEQILAESRRPSPDAYMLAKLKKEKLKIKQLIVTR